MPLEKRLDFNADIRTSHLRPNRRRYTSSYTWTTKEPSSSPGNLGFTKVRSPSIYLITFYAKHKKAGRISADRWDDRRHAHQSSPEGCPQASHNLGGTNSNPEAIKRFVARRRPCFLITFCSLGFSFCYWFYLYLLRHMRTLSILPSLERVSRVLLR